MGGSGLVEMKIQMIWKLGLSRPYQASGLRVVVKSMVPFLGTLNTSCRIVIGILKGTIILTTTHTRLRG